MELVGSPFNLGQGFFQLPFQISHVEPHGACAVQRRDANHNQIQALARRRLVGMIVEMVIDPLLEREVIAQTNHRRQIFHRPGIFRHRREGNSSRVDQRDLSAVFEKQDEIILLGFGMDFFLERRQIALSESYRLARRDIEDRRAAFVVERGLLVGFSPAPEKRLGAILYWVHGYL